MRPTALLRAIASAGPMLLCASMAVAGQTASARDTLPWSPDLCVPVQLNGVTLRLAIDTAMPVGIALNPDAALKAGVKPGWLEQMITVRLTTSSADPTVTFSGHVHAQHARVLDHRPEPVMLAWNEQTRISTTCDGNVSIWLVAAPKIALTRAAAPPPTREIGIPMTSPGGRAQIYGGQLQLGSSPFDVLLDVTAPDTLVNAPAARRLVREGRLRLSGNIRMHLVRYGIERPAEIAQFIDFKPFDLDISEVFAHGTPVESAEHGQDQVAPVTVNGRPPKETARPALTIGHKALARCRSITFDRTTHTVTLSCAD